MRAPLDAAPRRGQNQSSEEVYMTTVARALVLVVALASARVLEAQMVRGEITDGVNGRPVSGAVVLLLDGSDRTVAQALSDARGRYQLGSPAAGTFRVRALRIGFRPATSQQFTLASGADVSLAALHAWEPIALDTIRVVGRNSCEAMTDSRATFALWEQARTALTAARIAVRARNMSARVVTYQRTVRAKNGDMLSLHANQQSGATRNPFEAISADSLRKVGYVVSDARGWQTFFAPDLDVLLSEQFLADHCFRVAPQSDRARVGIAFEPTRERSRFAEIEGTIWLDRASSELRALEFLYDNVEFVLKDAKAGGDVHFARLENGAWVVSRWTIRMPVVERKSRAASGFGGGGSQVISAEVNEIKEEGGILAVVTQGDDTLFSAPPLVVTGVVRDSVSNAPMPGVRVAIRNSATASTTDATGAFRLTGMLPGRHVVEVSTPELSALGATHTLTVTATEHSQPMTVRLPGVDVALRRACPADTNGVITGTVFTSDSSAAREIRVVAEYPDRPTGGGAAGSLRTVNVTTDLRGRYRLCGVPIDTEIALVAESDSGNSAPVAVRVPRAARVLVVDLRLDRNASRNAVFTGTVMSDVNGAPVLGAQVMLPDVPRVAFTDERGAFRISNVPPGRHEINVRRLGYQQVNLAVDFAANQTIERRLLLSGVVVLDTVAATARAELPEFDEHRRLGLGAFWTPEQLEKQETRRVSEVLTQTPGLEVVRAGFGNVAWVASTRAGRTTANCWELEGATVFDESKRCNCYVQVYLDGLPLFRGKSTDQVPDINRIPVPSIQAIEFYRGPLETPLKYRNFDSDCGVLVLHTRRTPRRP